MKNDKDISPKDVHLADDGVVQAIGTGDIVMSIKTPHRIKKVCFVKYGTFQSYRETYSPLDALQRMSDQSHSKAMAILSIQKECNGSLGFAREKDCLSYA